MQQSPDIYVGTACGLAISHDSGVTWDYTDPTPGDGGGERVWDIIVHHDGIVDLCGDDGHLRSTNGGTTFIIGSTNEPAGICSLTVSPDEANELFMPVGTRISESRDGGASWPTGFANNHSQGRIPFVKVNDRAGSAFDLWYGDIQLFRASCSTPTNTTSTNQRCPASGSWTNAQTSAHWDVGDIVFNPTAAIDACPVLFSNDGGIYYNQNPSNPNCHDPNWEQPQTSVTALWLWDMDGNVRATAGQEGVYTGHRTPALSAPAMQSVDCWLEKPKLL